MKIPHNILELIGSEWFIEKQFSLTLIEKAIEFLSSSIEIQEKPKWNFSFSHNEKVFSTNYGDDIKSFNDAPAGSVALIPFSGIFLKYSSDYNYGSDFLASKIYDAANQKNISAICYLVDSPGGAVNAISQIEQATNYAKLRKPVVSLADVSCSAAYWVTCSTDYIFAENNISSRFGSIGVMTTHRDFSGLLEKLGIKEKDIYGPGSDFKNQEHRQLIDENKDDLLKSQVLAPLENKFKAHVLTSRAGKLNDKIPGIISGKTFFADAALEYGLIDSIGNMQIAIEKALQLADIKKFMNS